MKTWLRLSKMGKVEFVLVPSETVAFRIMQGAEFGIDVRPANADEINQITNKIEHFKNLLE